MNRLANKVRKNPDFIHATRLLDDLGIEWELCDPTGKGHAYLAIKGGLRWPVSTTPRGRMRTSAVRGRLMTALRRRGLA
jgi:hypothetical protein